LQLAKEANREGEQNVRELISKLCERKIKTIQRCEERGMRLYVISVMLSFLLLQSNIID
jgi:hypothetical protein